MAFDHLALPNDASPLSSEESTSSQADSPPDWSQFSSLWDGEFQPQLTNSKFEPASFNFALDIPLDMDLDFNPSLAVDPTALHFNPNMFATPDLPSFPPQQQVAFPQNLTPRRMSITSSSSSGASFSPVLDPTASSSMPSVPSTTAVSPNLSSAAHVPANGTVNDPVADLAQSVRQAAGVTLAVPVQGQAEQLAFSRMELLARTDPISSNSHELDAPKLPIPRLQRPSPATNTGPKRKSPGAEPNPSVDPSLGGTVAVIGRPKTSHTTIERRYRTNLNARIQSLKDAVPALRVLETKEKAKKGQDSPEAESVEKPVWNDTVDERGFVDGVKVARKISKANVLGKAAEYIQ
jgi:helix-loop-helix DNA-binding protein